MLPASALRKRVRAGARRVHLVFGRHVRGAHGPGLDLAADRGAVAHLDRGHEPALAREIEVRFELDRAVLRPEPQILGHRRRVDLLPGVHDAVRVENRLELAHRLVELGTEDHFVQLGALQAVAVLARHHSAEPVGHLGRFVRHLLHHLHAFGALEIDERANMETPGRGVRIVGGSRAMLGAHFLDCANELGQMIDRNRNVLDHRDRLEVAPNRIKQPQPRLAHRPDIGLPLGIEHPQRVGAHADLVLLQIRFQLVALGDQLGLGFAIELDAQQPRPDRLR